MTPRSTVIDCSYDNLRSELTLDNPNGCVYHPDHDPGPAHLPAKLRVNISSEMMRLHSWKRRDHNHNVNGRGPDLQPTNTLPEPHISVERSSGNVLASEVMTSLINMRNRSGGDSRVEPTAMRNDRSCPRLRLNVVKVAKNLIGMASSRVNNAYKGHELGCNTPVSDVGGTGTIRKKAARLYPSLNDVFLVRLYDRAFSPKLKCFPVTLLDVINTNAAASLTGAQLWPKTYHTVSRSKVVFFIYTIRFPFVLEGKGFSRCPPPPPETEPYTTGQTQ
ncbi:uncharacterized protein CC84DRAFT_1202094 [Paraphaeosphaeria sporulosa]|uniref:Uncharacterized protein n=1 Tax=Paraphaeosphaeria sporulosa TaxID=1460663 RepID=A0A177CRD5_9PLEO|nr:uncharacterized protein CC84DRAFT_1202094 [Paraphaeosphaeria sporulosa]OAG09329.1 hypothetical protein CC84DRAFT_1202094 [Paraphaeosphaeria sporulosa]